MTKCNPCPFCGGKAHTRTNTIYDRNYKWTVECETEGCNARVGCAFHRTEEDAIAAWNRRAERTAKVVEDEFGYLLCSECGAIQPDDYETYYCWNCGARQVD